MRRRLGALVRQFRQDARLTQRQLAELAGLSLGALRDLEQGRVATPRPEAIRRVAEVLRPPAGQADLLAPGAGHRKGTVPADDHWLGVLGPLALRIGGVAVRLGSHRQRLLLGRLALTPKQPVPLEEFTELAWDGRPPRNAAELVRVSVARLRRRLPAGMLAVDRGGYRLAARDDQLDLAVFRRLVDDARRLRQQREPELAARRFEEAVALWRGEPVAGLDRLAAHPVVVGLRAQWPSVAIEAAEALTGVGRSAEALPLLRQVLAGDPLHEAAHVRLMTALAGTGQREAALAGFRDLRDRLADQLGVDPSPELMDTFDRIRGPDETGESSPAPGPADTARPGTWPVSVHRLLPPDGADFTGRSAQLQAMYQRWQADPAHFGVMILTVAGMAGVGKTTLAVHFAHQLRAAGHYPDGEWYVDLRGHATEPPADPGAVLASFLRLLGVPGPQVPADLAEASALFRDRLADRRVLLLLDNAASEEQVQPLLPAGGSMVLVTSRRALALDGAHLLPLTGFAAGEAEQLLARVAGAERVDRDPAAATRVAELCGRLPLAVALAARQLRADPARSLADLADRLAAGEHRLDEIAAGTGWLRAALDLSYEALTGAEQRMFRLLGLHPGAEFCRHAAAALAGLDPASAAAHLDRLVDEHLATATSGDRYRLHDLLQEQAARAAHAYEPEPARRAAVTRLLDYYLHTTARAADALAPRRVSTELTGQAPDHGPALSERAAAVDWLEATFATLHAAIALAAGAGLPAHAWQLAQELRIYQRDRGRQPERVALQQLGLRAAQAAGDRWGEAMVRNELGAALAFSGNPQQAREHLLYALELATGADRDPPNGEPSLRTTIMNTLGDVCRMLGRYADALGYFEQAAVECRGRDPLLGAAAEGNIGRIQHLLGRYAAALDGHRRALARFRQAGEVNGAATALANLAEEYLWLGRYEQALARMAEFERLAAAHGFQRLQVYAALGHGRIYRELGQPGAALRYLREAQERLQRGSGDAEARWEVQVLLGGVHLDLGEPDRAHDLLQHGLTLAIETAGRYEQARTLDGLAELYRGTGQPDVAVEHERRAKAIYTELGVPPPRPAAARAKIEPATPSGACPAC